MTNFAATGCAWFILDEPEMPKDYYYNKTITKYLVIVFII